jgi:hypothetical protein
MDLWKVPPAVRMDRMGPSDPRMMMNYTHVASEDGRLFAAKMGRLLEPQETLGLPMPAEQCKKRPSFVPKLDSHGRRDGPKVVGGIGCGGPQPSELLSAAFWIGTDPTRSVAKPKS